MRAALISTVGASVSLFVPSVDFRPAVQPAVQPGVQTAAYAFLEPVAQPALQFAPSTGPAPAVVEEWVVPGTRSADDSLRWFSYGFVGALCAAAAGFRLKLPVANLATAGQRSPASGLVRARTGTRTAAVRMLESPPPSGFAWAESEAEAATKEVTTEAASTTELGGVAKPVAANEEAPEAPKATEAPKPKAPKAPKAPERELWKEGLFAPLVLGAKQVMGEQQLKELRAAVIAKHSKVITEFVDTSSSPFGQLVLQRMFEYADKDGNGTLDKEEVKAALLDLGFDFLNEKNVDQIMKNADADKNDVIDFEEFVKYSPKTLRTTLVKLAKKNGHDLGFLV